MKPRADRRAAFGGDGELGEAELYRQLGRLTRDMDAWEGSIPCVSSLLNHESVKIRARALWLLGEAGLAHPQSVQGAIRAAESARARI